MGVTIHTHLAALNVRSNRRKTEDVPSVSITKLLSGLRMNHASEDVSDMALADSSLPGLGERQEGRQKKLKVFSYTADNFDDTKRWYQ